MTWSSFFWFLLLFNVLFLLTRVRAYWLSVRMERKLAESVKAHEKARALHEVLMGHRNTVTEAAAEYAANLETEQRMIEDLLRSIEDDKKQQIMSAPQITIRTSAIGPVKRRLEV